MPQSDDSVALRARVAQLEAQLATAESDKAHLAEVLAEVRSERDYLRQAHGDCVIDVCRIQNTKIDR